MNENLKKINRVSNWPYKHSFDTIKHQNSNEWLRDQTRGKNNKKRKSSYLVGLKIRNL